MKLYFNYVIITWSNIVYLFVRNGSFVLGNQPLLSVGEAQN